MTERDKIDFLWDAMVRGPREAELHALRTAAAARPKPELPSEPIRYRPELLTSQQCRVAGLAADGLPNVEIAGRLGITARTVQTYFLKLCRTLGMIPNRVQLAFIVREWREGGGVR